MTLKEKIQADMISAMKAKDDLKVSVLRMVKAAILKFEVSGEDKIATDEVVMDVIKKEMKSRMDAAEGFKSGGNTAMMDKELAEAEILKVYLPEQMSEEQVKEEVGKILGEAGISSKADMGKAMGLVMAKLKGKADGGVINKTVGSLLK